MKALELANKLNSLCVAEFAWPHLNDAAVELRRLAEVNAELLGALEKARKELDGFPHSLGYDFDHIPAIDAAIAKAKEQQ